MVERSPKPFFFHCGGQGCRIISDNNFLVPEMHTNLQTKTGKTSALSFLLSPIVPVLVGSGACLWLYFLRDSFWRDESKLLLNIIHKSFLGLMGPLDYGQEGPLMILWLYRVLYLAGGQSEFTFRFPSLLAIICSMWLFQKLALNLLQEKVAVLFVTWLFALSPGIILFAAQAKQYALDILVSTFLLWLASITFFSPVFALHLVWLTLAVTIAPWFSLSAIFTVGPLLILMFLKAKVPVWRRFALCLPAAISCLLVVFMVLSRSLSSDQLQIASVFPTISRTKTLTSIQGFWGTFSDLVFFGYLGINSQHSLSLPLPFFRNEVSIALKMLVLLCSVGTIISFIRYGWDMIFLLVCPIAVTCFLVMLKFYPSLGRAFLFATPGLYLLAGFGLIFLCKGIPYRKPLILVLVFLVTVPCSLLWRYYIQPVGGVRDALKFISHNAKPEDMVFCDSYSASTVACYQALKNPDANELNYINRMDDWIEGKIKPNQVSLKSLFLTYDYNTIWLLAETRGYTWSAKDNLPDFANNVFHYLKKSRKIDFSYITPRVQAIGFSAASEKLLHNEFSLLNKLPRQLFMVSGVR